MTAPTSWQECAERLGTPVRSFEEHAQRWRESLRHSSLSSYSRHLGEDLEPSVRIGDALDAAAGDAFEAERLQRACFGEAWEQRQKALRRLIGTVRFPVLPPPGHAPDAWAAWTAIIEADLPDMQAVEKQFPDELRLLRNLESRSPEAYKSLVEAGDAIGAEIDGGARARAVAAAHELTTSGIFRTGWTAVFPNPRARPKAPFHLAVALLHELLPDARSKALFLEHCGLTQRRLRDLEGDDLLDALRAVDDEVHSALKSWRRLGKGEEHLRSARRLCLVIEMAIYEELRAASSGGPLARDSE